AVSAAQASRKLADTTAAPKISRAATGSRRRPTIRMTTAGAMNTAVISAERARVSRRARGVAGTAAAALSTASIVILQLIEGCRAMGSGSARLPTGTHLQSHPRNQHPATFRDRQDAAGRIRTVTATRG